MKHYYPNVPGLGNVAVSRHAQDRMRELMITQAEFEGALAGKTIPDGASTIWKEAGSVRLVVILRPEPFRGAALVTTVYRIDGPARV